MNPSPGATPHDAAPCSFAWCTTNHGRTVHPDDEIHRSAGTGFIARVRGGDVGGAGVLTDVEVGLVRRSDDDDAWVALEFGGGHAIAIDPGAARTLGRLLRDDPVLAVVLADGESSGRRMG